MSCGMIKHPPPGRVAAHRGSGVFSNWTCRPQLGVPRFATVIPSRGGMRTSPPQTAPCPTTGWCQVSCGMLKHPPPGRVAAHRGSGVFSNWTCRPQLGVPRFATVTPSRGGMRTSPRQTAPCPTTGWCQASFGMLKHPPPGRVAACRGSGVFSNWTHPTAPLTSPRGRTVTHPEW